MRLSWIPYFGMVHCAVSSIDERVPFRLEGLLARAAEDTFILNRAVALLHGLTLASVGTVQPVGGGASARLAPFRCTDRRSHSMVPPCTITENSTMA